MRKILVVCKRLPKWLRIVLAFLAALVVIFFLFFRDSWSAYQEQRDHQQTIKAVGKLIELPDTAPQLATVIDKTMLSDQSFFDTAENGDKVLVFHSVQKVVLYRPKTNKIINFSNIGTSGISTESQQANAISAVASPVPTPLTTPPPTPVPTPAPSTDLPSVAIYNGTTSPGLTQKIQQMLQEASASGEIVVRQNAAVTNYTETLIVVISSAFANQARDIAALLEATVVPLPSGEQAPAADVLIIAGQDAAGT